MVNGNYVLYGERPSSESEVVDDHVHTRNERKVKRKNHRTANELQPTLNLAQLDNDTDSVKYEKKIKEPRLLRYVPTTDVEENFVTDKFETYDLKPTEERPRRYAFTKKPKNPADGSVNYAYSVYSHSSSACSSPNANLPTISEHGEQYGTYRVRPMPNPIVNDLMAGYDTKLDKYFTKPREIKPFTAKGSHPDSLYRVAADSGSDGHKITRILRVIRWPIALIAICAALAAFVYFLMPENLDPKSTGNRTYWERVPAGVGLRMKGGEKDLSKDAINKLGNKPSEIDFYEAPNEKNDGLSPVTDPVPENTQRKLQIPPVYPAYVAPEVQYGNEKADLERRTAKFLEDAKLYNSTVKPHITQKPEKPLAIYFKDANELTTVTSETITRAETVNDFTNYVETNKNVNDPIKWNPPITKDIVPPPKRYISQVEHENNAEHGFYTRVLPNVNFTSGHSNLFGISIEDAEKMKSTTQNALYNTRVSPTLPTWRDRDDTTTKNYPNNYSDVQCTSTHMPLCRGVLPYDLAGVATKIGNLDMTSLLTQIEYLVSTNCSDRVRHFVCALLEPECSPPPYPQKMPCYNLCKAIMDSCDGHIPRELIPAFNCKLYPHANCMAPKTPCYNREFTCGEGSCIPRDWLCDGRKDCPGGEDEQKCTNCEANEYKCPAGGCIPKAWKCDGYKDCPGGDDESEGTCGARREPGEEAAASAPAHSVRRPHARPNAQRKHSPASQHNDNDSSKELLVTSYSSNGFPIKRTSAPSIHRLTPYNRSSTPSSRNQKKVNSRESLVPEYVDDDSETKKPQAVASKPILIENESVEDLNVGDLGFSDDLDRMEHSGSPKLQRQRSKFRPANRKAVRPKPQIDTNTEKKHEPVSFAANENKARNSNQINDENGMTPSSDEGADGDAKVAQEKRAPARTGDFDSGHHNSWSRAHASPCPSGELRCVDGRCITLAQLCDGTLDCSDHADEDNCYT